VWGSDGEVLEAARGGDPGALELLVTTHYDRVHAVCRRMLGNDADALDATQDTLVAAIRALGRFDGRSSVSTWLYRIATNTCLDEIRRRRRRPVIGFEEDVAGTADSANTANSANTADSADALTSARTGGGRDPADVVAARMDIDAALVALPEEFRAAVVLRDVCDLPYEEIAAVLGVPVGTVRSRLARGRAALAATWKAPVATGNRAGAPDVKRPERSPQEKPTP
jgi:RNA polymerase sigma-70 factor, ECF subfamily